MEERIRQFVITSQFIRSVCKLAQQECRKVWETLDKFARDPTSPGLNREPLSGAATGLYSIRVDRDYRIIFFGEATPVLLHVGSHDDAYRIAERVAGPSEVDADVAPRTTISYWGVSMPSVAAEMRAGTTVKSEHLMDLILRTRKYLPITEFLTSRPPQEKSCEMTFERIERLLGKPLPDSAHRHRAWWANNLSHVQATSWLTVRWETRNVRTDVERVTFARIEAR
jgi:Txe/YoeB family toxin of Txe-Axe toxin-antitoxin module